MRWNLIKINHKFSQGVHSLTYVSIIKLSNHLITKSSLSLYLSDYQKLQDLLNTYDKTNHELAYRILEGHEIIPASIIDLIYQPIVWSVIDVVAAVKIEIIDQKPQIHLDLSKRNIRKLPDDFYKIQELHSLDLSHNLIEEIPSSFEAISSKLQSLKMIDSPKLNIDAIAQISKIRSLKSLYLGSCRLPYFPKSILKLKDLEALHLSVNRISIVPESIGQMYQLKHLDLSHNEIQRLPHSIYQLPEISLLNVQNNPLGETEKYPLKRLSKYITVYY
jgi:Leucine-rich repeat (LRR) protein